MIESIAGIIVGILVGMNVDLGFSALGGAAVPLIVFLALADELISAAGTRDKYSVSGLIGKAVFCGASIWIEAKTGTPLGPFVMLVLMISIYRRLAWPAKTVAGVK